MVHLENSITIVQNTRHIILRLFLLQKLKSNVSYKEVIGNIIQKANYDVGQAWRLAAKQFQYFSNPEHGYIVGEVIKLNRDGISEAAKNMNIQTGDLLYFSSSAASLPHHATIISKVEGNEIYFAGNTRSRFDAPLSECIGDEMVFIVRIHDDAK